MSADSQAVDGFCFSLKAEDIAARFADTVESITPLGNGLINDTFLVNAESRRFVLQRINRQVFPEPLQIMANMAVLTDHLRQQTGVEKRTLKFPELLRTLSGNSFVIDEGEVWRALAYIERTESLECVRNLSDAYQAGLALGRFHRLFCDLDPRTMADTLPGFHITPEYLCRYHEVLTEKNFRADSADSRYCLDFIAAHEAIADDLERPKMQSLLRLSVTHGDPKLNNFLFDVDSKQVVSLIDLDTVKPGLWHYDVGDCLRSCCHQVDSNEFDSGIAGTCLEGYLSEARGFFAAPDYRYLYRAIRLIPFELGLRFFTDYLEGNRYFKVTEADQNLQRATAQFRLCASIMAQEEPLKRLIDRLEC